MPHDLADWFLADIGIRWETHQWIAFNIGRPNRFCSKLWSTGLGSSADIEDIFVLFRHSTLTFFPPAAGTKNVTAPEFSP